MKTKKGMYKDFKCITHLYILSTGALDCFSSPKGVLEAGRTTPSKIEKVQITLNFWLEYRQSRDCWTFEAFFFASI